MKNQDQEDLNRDTAISPKVLDAYIVDTGTEEFVDRMMQAIRIETEDRTRHTAESKGRRLWVIGAISALALVITLVLMSRTSGGQGSLGEEFFSQRGSASIGSRAVAVAEPDSKLSWEVDATGIARVAQRKGNIFYRVDPGELFVVTTPAGDITVLGTCFRVEVNPMKLTKKSLLSAGVGAALSASVLVTVYEGKVLLANQNGTTEITAGQSATTTATSAPVRESTTATAHGASNEKREELERENEKLRRHIATLEAQAHELQTKSKKIPDDAIVYTMNTFEKETRDEVWAPAKESVMEEKLQKFFDIPEASVECRTKCCQLDFTKGRVPFELLRELNSSVGFALGSTATSHSFGQGEHGKQLIGAGFCFDRESDISQEPNRALEREQLLARAAPTLKQCAMQAAVPFTLFIDLVIDDSGAISDVKSSADTIPDDAADCAVDAIMEHARFSSATSVTTVPINVTLDPADES